MSLPIEEVKGLLEKMVIENQMLDDTINHIVSGMAWLSSSSNTWRFVDGEHPYGGECDAILLVFTPYLDDGDE